MIRIAAYLDRVQIGDERLDIGFLELKLRHRWMAGHNAFRKGLGDVLRIVEAMKIPQRKGRSHRALVIQRDRMAAGAFGPDERLSPPKEALGLIKASRRLFKRNASRNKEYGSRCNGLAQNGSMKIG